MTHERRDFAGAAAATTISSGIGTGDTSVSIVSGTGWPLGTNGPFFAVIDRGLSTEEKIKVTTRTGTTLSPVTRGADGTTAAAHSAGAAIEHCFTKTDADEANSHYADTGLDHHTQYLNVARHDIEARHTFGAAYGTPATPQGVAPAGGINQAGTGNNPAREDHIHAITSGSIDRFALDDQIPFGFADSDTDTTGGVESVLEVEALSVGVATGDQGSTTRTFLVVVKILAIVDTDDDANWVKVRVKRDGTVIDSMRVPAVGSGHAGVSMVVVDEDVPAGIATYSVTLEPDTGDAGWTASGADGNAARLWVIDIGGVA